MKKKRQLHTFFAVTLTSIYHVRDKDEKENGSPSAKKIALRGESTVSVGQGLRNGTMIAVCECLRAYIPEGGGITSFQRRIEQVNTRWWGGSSSEIVALFLSLPEAESCFRNKDLVPSDPRWEVQTRRVVREIGEEHPVFYVCRYPGISMTFFTQGREQAASI